MMAEIIFNQSDVRDLRMLWREWELEEKQELEQERGEDNIAKKQ